MNEDFPGTLWEMEQRFSDEDGKRSGKCLGLWHESWRWERLEI